MRLTSPTLSFGVLLKQLRKQAGMTQRDLAAALNYSDSLISSLEKEQRLPDLTFVVECLIPALGLQDDPKTAAWLVERAAVARGEQPPASFTFQRTTRLVLHEELFDHTTALPALPTQLIGRSEEVTQLCHRLLGHQGRLLTLVGPPGIGKTTLALAVAAHLQPHYREGVVFVPLAAVSDNTVMADTILAAVSGRDASGKPPTTQLIAFLRRKSMLLVLDNLEQLKDAAALIAEVLTACPGLVILATSRERLHLRAEQRYKVPPLALPAAVTLFVQRAQAVHHEFSLTAQNRPTLEAICERLDRLPLALELCAAQIELFSPAQLLTTLQARPLDLLVDGAQDLPPQHRTLRAAIGRSYQLLPEEEQALLRSLSVFVGGFALSEVEQVHLYQPETQTRPLPAVLHALIQKSLVRSETTAAGEQRFLLLETIREFALEQLRAHGEEAELRQRHYLAYLRLFRAGDSHLRGPEAATWMVCLTLEQDNLRAALQWTLDEARYVDMQWLLLASTWYWVITGKWHEFGRWPRQLLPYRHLLPPPLHLVMLTNMYAFARAVEEFQPINRFHDEMIQLMEICPHPILHAGAWHFIAEYYSDFSQAAAARERAIAAARLAREKPTLGPEYGLFNDCDFTLGITLWAFAYELVERGFFDRATPLLQECQEIFRHRENPYLMNYVLGTMGRLAFLQDDLTQAQVYLQEVVIIANTFNYGEMIGLFQPALAIVTFYRGDTQAAKRLLHDSLRLCIELKDKRFLAQITLYLAEIALAEEDVEQSEQQLRLSLSYQSAIQNQTIDQVTFFFIAACLATAQHHYQRAANLFGLAEQVQSQIRYVIGGPMRSLANAALAKVQAELESAVLAEAFASGQQMSLEEAFATILAPGRVAGVLTKE